MLTTSPDCSRVRCVRWCDTMRSHADTILPARRYRACPADIRGHLGGTLEVAERGGCPGLWRSSPSAFWNAPGRAYRGAGRIRLRPDPKYGHTFIRGGLEPRRRNESHAALFLYRLRRPLHR